MEKDILKNQSLNDNLFITLEAYSFTSLTTSELLLAHHTHFLAHEGRKCRQVGYVLCAITVHIGSRRLNKTSTLSLMDSLNTKKLLYMYLCEDCTVHTEARARKARKSQAEAFGFTGLFSSCVSAVAAVLPCTCVTHPRKHGCFSSTTIRREADCHPTPAALFSSSTENTGGEGCCVRSSAILLP